ncbi:MAG: Stage V sporulation protein AC (SpoVAC) [Brockia lithotrophica]|uniref:Stage V sporulation protein AC (SpoVAC) n=1 Tax=Brockia lithotrophica TaxID=933949 RepID=A0A2T5G3Y2_9BACL|nr:stage V sporulation protein AC [Brockia lithotrophica]MBT9252564.1 stage V sporulation protein AC [Brockia lithotrophica]PTQ50898.1 MAG: Stage V sporulation protein AC (SpoVAC) [Brockia lithotrophica]
MEHPLTRDVLSDPEAYQRLARDRETPRPVLLNSLRAFLVGGAISLFGQLVTDFYVHVFHFSPKEANNPTVATLIFFAVLLTGLGWYDRIGQWGGAGAIVPVTGFANTMASSALDHRSEGYVLGVGGNMFKVAGPVIVFGVVSAFAVVLVRSLAELLVRGAVGG